MTTLTSALTVLGFALIGYGAWQTILQTADWIDIRLVRAYAHRRARRTALDLRGHDWEPGPNGPLHFTTCWCRPDRACRCHPTGDQHSALCRAARQ